MGEYKVGIDFNPSGDPVVTNLKKKAAAFIDAVNKIVVPEDVPDAGRLKALAMTEAKGAAMMAWWEE